MSNQLFKYGDFVSFTKDSDDLTQSGGAFKYNAGGKGTVVNAKTENDKNYYTVKRGMTSIANVPEDALQLANADVKEAVQRKLNEDQKAKMFKDTGARVSGSAKEKRAYDKIVFADL
jgi:hypothetical protein